MKSNTNSLNPNWYILLNKSMQFCTTYLFNRGFKFSHQFQNTAFYQMLGDVLAIICEDEEIVKLYFKTISKKNYYHTFQYLVNHQGFILTSESSDNCSTSCLIENDKHGAICITQKTDLEFSFFSILIQPKTMFADADSYIDISIDPPHPL